MESAIDDYRGAQHIAGALKRDVVSAQPRRHDETRLDEGPIRRFVVVFIDHVIGRQRRPADISVATAPIDPGRTPIVARHPEPSEAALENPAAIVIGHPAPIGFIIVGYPVPAPVVGIDPVTDAIGTPAARPLIRHPDVAPARVLPPFAIRRERLLKFVGELGIGRRQRADHDGRR
jgi:hypothetical protein